MISRASRWPASHVNGQMTVHTSYGDTQWPVVAGSEAGTPGAYAIATRAANDATLDHIAFSRGRFVIEAPGALPLAVPSWAEVSRVIEDCRG